MSILQYFLMEDACSYWTTEQTNLPWDGLSVTTATCSSREISMGVFLKLNVKSALRFEPFFPAQLTQPWVYHRLSLNVHLIVQLAIKQQCFYITPSSRNPLERHSDGYLADYFMTANCSFWTRVPATILLDAVANENYDFRSGWIDYLAESSRIAMDIYTMFSYLVFYHY